MRQIYLWLTAILFFSQASSEQQLTFLPPVKGEMQLTGTFGELRGDHFHAGLDIRGGIGRAVYAIADGYVSRIKVTVSGYGQAIYVTHPATGHLAVYGHLDRFRDDLMDYTRKQQYTNERFLLDAELGPEQFPVKAGELIGYIGARGYVSGPHLHFEIRDLTTERNLNPMNFGITVPDSRRPFIRGLRMYELASSGRVLQGEDFAVVRRGGGRYTLQQDTLFVRQPYIGLAIKAYDQQDGRPNYNGIYQLEFWQNDSLRFHYRMDDFAGAQTRYLNAHLDYEQQRSNNSWFQRAYQMPGNELDIYQTDSLQGCLSLLPGEVAQLRFRVSDHRDNEATLELVVKRMDNIPVLQNPVYTYHLHADEENIIDDGACYAHFFEHTLYENLYLDYHRVDEQSDGLYAPVHRLHRNTTPLHRYFDLHLRPYQLPDALRSKAFIAYCPDGGEPISYGGDWTEDDRLRAPVRAFGNFTIMVDTVAPIITPERWARDMRGWDRFSFKIDDNFPTAGKAHDLRFRAEVDGQWILLEYDGRKQRLYHDFDGHIARGQHEMVLRVRDDRGNETEWRGEFQY